MGRALQIRFFFPLPLLAAGEQNDRAFRRATAKFLQNPDFLNATQFDIHNAGIGQSVSEQRFGIFHADAMDDAILFRIQTGAEDFHQLRMRSQH